MSNQVKEQKITIAREALQRSRELKRSRRAMGVDGIRQFVKDVDGDWLNNWTDTAHKENIQISCTSMQVLIWETFLYFSALNLLCLSVLSLSQKLNVNTET
jgi:hypothetical protein